jgi:hypothetical protein
MKYIAYLLGVISAITMIAVASVQPQAQNNLPMIQKVETVKFFSESHGAFDIEGYIYQDRNNACQMNTHWDNGDYWSLVLDMVDGELWMETRLNRFDVPQTEWGKYYNMSWSFNNSSGTYITHQRYQAYIKNKDTLQFRGMDGATDEAKIEFWTRLASSHHFALWDTWNTEEMVSEKLVVQVALDGSRAAINALTRCYQEYQELMK